MFRFLAIVKKPTFYKCTYCLEVNLYISIYVFVQNYINLCSPSEASIQQMVLSNCDVQKHEKNHSLDFDSGIDQHPQGCLFLVQENYLLKLEFRRVTTVSAVTLKSARRNMKGNDM